MKEIADAAFRFQQKLDSDEFKFVGMNALKEEAAGPKIEILKIGMEYQIVSERSQRPAGAPRFAESCRNTGEAFARLEDRRTELPSHSGSLQSLRHCW